MFPLDDSLGGLRLIERRLDVPYVKDYDTIAGESPVEWAKRFDMSNWGMISAVSKCMRVGGAVVAFHTDGLSMLEHRRDLALLWNIRVSPEARRRGIGFALLWYKLL